MEVEIYRFGTPVMPCTVAWLREQLQFRDENGYASYWLWHGNGNQMGVMFNYQQAYVYFFSNKKENSFALPTVAPENPDELVAFLADNHEPTPMPKWTVVDAAIAEEAIIIFFESGERLSTVAWGEL